MIRACVGIACFKSATNGISPNRHGSRALPGCIQVGSFRAMQSVLAIDSGTTGATCLVIGADGRVLGRGYHEIPQHYPEPGRVEHEPLDILRCTLDAARDALSHAAV